MINFNTILNTHKLVETEGSIRHFRPATPELHGDDIQIALSVQGSYNYRWNTDCISIDRKDNEIKIDYHTWYHYDKYDEGLEKEFTVTIKNNYTLIEFDNFTIFSSDRCGWTNFGKVNVNFSSEWFKASEIPEKPKILDQFVNTGFSYSIMDLGENIYLALCQIYKNKELLNLDQILS